MINKKYNTLYFNKDFIKLNQQIRELRNKANHAFLVKSIGEKDIRNSINNLKGYIKNFELMTENNSIFINKKLIKLMLTK